MVYTWNQRDIVYQLHSNYKKKKKWSSVALEGRQLLFWIPFFLDFSHLFIGPSKYQALV